MDRLADSFHRAARVPLIGYPMLACWDRGWLPKPRNDVTARLADGRILRCRLADRTQRTMSLGLFEPAESRLVADLVGPGDVFIDVGAHIGWFTTIAARRIAPDGYVIACEPYPQNAQALKENLELNNATNVRVLEVALGSRAGTLSLGSAGDSGGVTALPWARDSRTEIPMLTLDEVAADFGPIAMLKVDVEGWEAEILRGAPKTLARTRTVLIELNRPALAAAGTSPGEIGLLLRAAGFTTFKAVSESFPRRIIRSRNVTNALATR